MAAEPSSTPVNGNHTPHQGYGSIEQSNGTTMPAESSSTAPPTSASGTSDIPKDEVGWYFVEQYYTTLSRSPEKLYLFYNKRSQFVLGQETDKVPVCVGQRSINERFKELDFQDCKVRVTNVDSQASDANIVIQVIGEISNKAAPHKKFTQTFVLAAQTNGYFVLNDIFRYIIEEEDEAETQAQQPAEAVASSDEPVAAPQPEAEPATLTSSPDPAAIERDAALVDKKIEASVQAEQPTKGDVSPPPNRVNGALTPVEAELAHADDTTAAAPAAPEEKTNPPVPEVVESVQHSEPEAEQEKEALQPEEPQAPEPTPVASPAKQAAKPAAPAASPAPAASKPSVPKSWASLAAAAHKVVAPAAPAPQSVSPAAVSAKTAPVTSPAPSSAAAPSAPATTQARAVSPAPSQTDEWTSVGGDKKSQQQKGQTGAAAQEGPQHRAYIKNVSENVDIKELRALLEKFGELAYFDVSRQKNCAFVDFKTAEGYKGATEGNPHTLGNERIIVEERRLKPGSYPYVQRGGMRGGRGGQANQGQGQGQGRGAFQGGRGGRGDFTPRGRGGAASRGRGSAQAA